MDGLFSHADPPAEPLPSREAIQVRVQVPVDAVQAAEGFLDYLHLWWPVNLYSVSGAGAHLWWDAEGFAEEAEDGSRQAWGRSMLWDPPLVHTVSMDLPGIEGDEWSLRFSPSGVATTAVFRAPQPRRLPGLGGGAVPADLWPQVLGFYARFMGGELVRP